MTSTKTKVIYLRTDHHVSLNPKHHYVTQSGLFDNPITGPLTDKRIEFYQRERLKRMGITLPTTGNKKKKQQNNKPQPKALSKNKQMLAALLAD
jgi:hypothetical protein